MLKALWQVIDHYNENIIAEFVLRWIFKHETKQAV